MAILTRFAPTVGSVSAARVVNDEVEQLYDYDELRRIDEPTVFVVHVRRSAVVLGSRQLTSVLKSNGRELVGVRRRRGGGGLVLLQPGDLWVDWWIPVRDPRWSPDLGTSSIRAGQWWCDALTEEGVGGLNVHGGHVEAGSAADLVCFAGRGPGEVFRDERKVVGITQWRVREGAFVSTVLPGSPSGPLLDLLDAPPVGLLAAMNHHTISTLAIQDVEAVESRLVAAGGAWRRRDLLLLS